MRFTIEKVRFLLVLLGVALLGAIASFYAYSRYRIHEAARDLPQKLGIEIQQSTNGFTISKSHAGRTLFVLHASKAVQFKGTNHAVLHDVSILMYDKDGAHPDHISGKRFDYDQGKEVARADGPVEIELTNPGKLPGTKAGSSTHPSILVKTSGLIFDQKNQLARTDQPLTFQQGDTYGSARGASYDSAKGMLTLAHDVVLKSVVANEPISLRAQGASFDRVARRLYLIGEEADYQQEHGSSDQATLFIRPDGDADHLLAQGNVHLKTQDGSDLRAASGAAQFNGQGLVQQARMEGGLLYVGNDRAHSLHVNSTGAVFNFVPTGGGKTALGHVQLLGAVSVVDQQLNLPGDANGSETREARASQMAIDLSPAAHGHAEVEKVVASEGATIIVHTIHSQAPQERTTLRGDNLVAILTGGRHISSLHGTGNTSFEQSTPAVMDRTSTGDTLDVSFLSPPEKVKGAGSREGRAKADKFAASGTMGASQIRSAVQQGHAMLVETHLSSAYGNPAKTTATADRICFDGSRGEIQLSGGKPRITQPGSELTANAIKFQQSTGNAIATGSVKAAYTQVSASQPGQRESSPPAPTPPVHVVADHAFLDHIKDEATFNGNADNDARVWQGGNSITAPTLVLARSRQLLTAFGPASTVRATFIQADSKRVVKTNQPPVQTASSKLIYSGGERTAVLSGGVNVKSQDGEMRASTVNIFLDAETPASSGRSAGFGPGGKVDRMVAEGAVSFSEGSRTAVGEKLVYTAEDGHFVLTGSSANEPRVNDPDHGTVSGSSLIFNNRDDSVEVSRGQSATTTETRTNNRPRANLAVPEKK